MSMTNLFSEVPTVLPDELIHTLLTAESFRIERIVSHGHSTPPDLWYDQDQHEWVLLITGAARLQFEDKVIQLRPGDFINIPAHRRHRVEWTSHDDTTIWLTIHYE